MQNNCRICTGGTCWCESLIFILSIADKSRFGRSLSLPTVLCAAAVAFNCSRWFYGLFNCFTSAIIRYLSHTLLFFTLYRVFILPTSIVSRGNHVDVACCHRNCLDVTVLRVFERYWSRWIGAVAEQWRHARKRSNGSEERKVWRREGTCDQIVNHLFRGDCKVVAFNLNCLQTNLELDWDNSTDYEYRCQDYENYDLKPNVSQISSCLQFY